MHDEARAWVTQAVERYGPFTRVLEYGGRDVNGSVRDLFGAANYVSVDIRPGPGVDIIADAASWISAIRHDCVVCCEVFEHTPYWPEIIANAWSSLEGGGYLIATMATDPRAPHSSLDGGHILEAGEHYANISQTQLERVMAAVGFHVCDIYSGGDHADLYVTGVK